MAKNPKWAYEELILALELYFKIEAGLVSNKFEAITRLSELLNSFPFFPGEGNDTYRNFNGVSMKLSNFMALDPNYAGKGMSAYSKQDEAVFDEFKDDKDKLSELAAQVRLLVANKKVVLAVLPKREPASKDYKEEGSVIVRFHKHRERNSKIVKDKKDEVLKTFGVLKCEVCGFDFSEIYGDIGSGFIECHHNIPLSETSIKRKPTLNDFSLVCSNCHSMLHAVKPILSVSELRVKWKR